MLVDSFGPVAPIQNAGILRQLIDNSCLKPDAKKQDSLCLFPFKEYIGYFEDYRFHA